MSDYTDIQQELDDFENAVYGEEVRDSMISAIKKIHDVAESAADAPDASSATAGQVLTADGNGGHYWGDVESGDIEMTPVDVSYELASVEDIPEGGGSTGGLAFDSGYQDAQGYIHLTKNGVDIPLSSFTPFKVTVGGDAETITAINAI